MKIVVWVLNIWFPGFRLLLTCNCSELQKPERDAWQGVNNVLVHTLRPLQSCSDSVISLSSDLPFMIQVKFHFLFELPSHQFVPTHTLSEKEQILESPGFSQLPLQSLILAHTFMWLFVYISVYLTLITAPSGQRLCYSFLIYSSHSNWWCKSHAYLTNTSWQKALENQLHWPATCFMRHTSSYLLYLSCSSFTACSFH